MVTPRPTGTRHDVEGDADVARVDRDGNRAAHRPAPEAQLGDRPAHVGHEGVDETLPVDEAARSIRGSRISPRPTAGLAHLRVVRGEVARDPVDVLEPQVLKARHSDGALPCGSRTP